MKKKIYILSLIFLFTLSTTGMPLMMHYCGSMDSLSLWSSIQFGEYCEMHSPKVEELSCCESTQDKSADNFEYPEGCCEDYIIDNSVKDTFLSSKIELNIYKEIISIISFSDNLIEIASDKNIFNTDHSPPLITNNKIYLSISVFLI